MTTTKQIMDQVQAKMALTPRIPKAGPVPYTIRERYHHDVMKAQVTKVIASRMIRNETYTVVKSIHFERKSETIEIIASDMCLAENPMKLPHIGNNEYRYVPPKKKSPKLVKDKNGHIWRKNAMTGGCTSGLSLREDMQVVDNDGNVVDVLKVITAGGRIKICK